MQLTTEAIAVARAIGDRELEGRFRLPILIAYLSNGRLQEGLDLLDESSNGEWSRSAINVENVGSRAFRASFLTLMGRLREARGELERAIELSQRLGRTVSWMHAQLVELAYFAGTPESAVRDSQTAVRSAEDFDSPFFRVIAYRSLALSHVLHEQWRNAIEVVERFMPLVGEGQPARQYESAQLSLLAECYLGVGRIEESVVKAREAVASAMRSHMRTWELRARVVLCRSLLAAEGVAAAGEVNANLELLEELVRTTGEISFAPFLHELRAGLANAAGDLALARSEREKAAARFREIGADGHVARLDKQLRQDTLKVG
jgi:tetratricopeptide (TPR) repeat protein